MSTLPAGLISNLSFGVSVGGVRGEGGGRKGEKREARRRGGGNYGEEIKEEGMEEKLRDGAKGGNCTLSNFQ